MKNSVESPDNQSVMDPRKKEGQGLDFWAQGLLKNHLISQDEYNDFVAKNNLKEERLEEGGFPQLKHYGFFKSIAEIKERITPEGDERFIIRCASKENGDIKRLIDASIDEVCAFAEELPGGFEKWKVEVKEFTDTIAAGTIIVDPSGRATIESWHGPHYMNVENTPRYRAEFDPGQFHQSYQWIVPEGAKDAEQMKEYALKAMQYAFPHLKPKPDEPIYIEYGVKPDGQVYFIEANDSPLLTGK